MTDTLGPVGRPQPPRRAARGPDGALAEAPDASRALIPIEPMPEEAVAEPAPPKARRAGFASFAAQILSGGPKRGLRAGQETLVRARASYLETEWSGPADRRLKTGRITKTEV